MVTVDAQTPECRYFVADLCRSCALIETPYAVQLRDKDHACQETLGTHGPAAEAWLPPVAGGVTEFRNRAKLAVGGEVGAVTLGILDLSREANGRGIDLTDCLIHQPGLQRAIPRIAEFLNSTKLAPYSVPHRKGELKYAHLTEAPSGDLMVRFVVRSSGALDRIRALMPELREQLPQATVISVNLLPEHKAVLEGEHEELLYGSSLAMDLGSVSLHLQPQSFFQTNTKVAQSLYAQAAEWTAQLNPASLWDLYCGVGGFALFCADAGDESGMRDAVGIEVSEAAIRSATRSASDAGIPVRFQAGDATAFALESSPESAPELVIVNPPRRGIGSELADWLEGSATRSVIYSSCNPKSLAQDLARMPSLRAVKARLFDMFPHTGHAEVMVLLERVALE